MHSKEIQNFTKKIQTNDKRIEAIDKILQEEQSAVVNEQAKKEEKKQQKAPPVPAKKGKDAGIISGNPLEVEKADLLKDNEKCKESQIKYEEKLQKLKDQREKIKLLNEKLNNGQLTIELCDKAGERKFIKPKLTQDASTFLADKNSYILGYLVPGQTPDEEETVEPFTLEGYSIRTIEEDVGAVDEILIQQKKDDKKKGVAKKK